MFEIVSKYRRSAMLMSLRSWGLFILEIPCRKERDSYDRVTAIQSNDRKNEFFPLNQLIAAMKMPMLWRRRSGTFSIYKISENAESWPLNINNTIVSMLQSFPFRSRLWVRPFSFSVQLLITGELYRCSIRRYPMERTVNYVSIGVSFLLLREM